jgi:peptidoglycan/xylan/chitin deacetylase (PgdA/CDA1 family)
MSWYPLIRDVGASALHWSGWSDPRRRLNGKLSIATFHRVLTESERKEYPLPGLAVTPEELAIVLASLAERFTCTTLADAAKRWAAGIEPERPLLALTFDDGQRDNLTRAAPVLDTLGLKATFFVVSSAAQSGTNLWHDRLVFGLTRASARQPEALHALLAELRPSSTASLDLAALVELAKTRFPGAAPREAWIARLEAAAGGPWRPGWDGMLDFADLRSLRQAGHEIGSHSLSHPLLPQCSDEELEREITGSKRDLERESGGSVSSFCYPNGSWNSRVLAGVRRAGYDCAVTTQHGWNGPGAEILALSRCDLSYVYCVDRAGRFSPARLAWRLGRASVRRGAG